MKIRFEWDLFLVKFTNMEKLEGGEFYWASDSFIKAAQEIDQNLTDNEFVDSIENIGNVEFEIDIEEYKRKKST